MFTYELLNTRHESCDTEQVDDYWALYSGGKQFAARLGRFLPQQPHEHIEYYEARKKNAHYRNYAGPIIDFFGAHLFSAPFEVRSKDAESQEVVEADSFYSTFREDCDTNDTDLVDFMRARFVEALVCKSSYWLVELPDDEGVPPGDKAEWEARKLGDGYVKWVPHNEVLDWECDEYGKLLWAIVHKTEKLRTNPQLPRKMVTETWWLYDRENVETFQIQYEDGYPPPPTTPIPSISVRKHKCNRVPLLSITIDPEGLWVMNRIASVQLEHFRQANAHSWHIKRTCFAMPVFHVEDGDNFQFGIGRYLKMGVNEKVEWLAPPPAPYDAISKEVASLKDEIFRICHQMALGVDNNAAAIGRSGDSKLADANATEVVLKAYGAIVCGAIEETFEVLSDARGDTDVTWSIEGFRHFDLADALVIVEAAQLADQVDIPSETYHREIKTKVALGILHDVSQDVKDEIKSEIEAGIKDQMQMKADAAQADLDRKQNEAEAKLKPPVNPQQLMNQANAAASAKASSNKDEKAA